VSLPAERQQKKKERKERVPRPVRLHSLSSSRPAPLFFFCRAPDQETLSPPCATPACRPSLTFYTRSCVRVRVCVRPPRRCVPSEPSALEKKNRLRFFSFPPLPPSPPPHRNHAKPARPRHQCGRQAGVRQEGADGQHRGRQGEGGRGGGGRERWVEGESALALSRSPPRRSAIAALRGACGPALTLPSPPPSRPPQAVADIVRTTLGPRAMLKMLLDAGGGEWMGWKKKGWRARRREREKKPPPSPLFPHPPRPRSLSFPGIVLTNDGNAILREIDVSHPAAKVSVVGRRVKREDGCASAHACARASLPLPLHPHPSLSSSPSLFLGAVRYRAQPHPGRGGRRRHHVRHHPW
jgi:hypothetical protein